VWDFHEHHGHPENFLNCCKPIDVVYLCMDVANLCMVLLVMVNENPRVEKPYSAYGPTVILTVYGSADGLR